MSDEKKKREFVPKEHYEQAEKYAKFVADELERVQNWPTAFLIGRIVANAAEAATEVWKERAKWSGWKK